MKRTPKNFLLLCIVSFFIYLLIGLTFIPQILAYTTPENANVGMSLAIASGLFGLGGGIALAITGSSAISAITEKPEVFVRAFMIVSLAEAIAIYGLLLGILAYGGIS
ncbi:MAG: ATP synthase subunit C [Candidatus Helarchaeota archaeon]